MDELKDQQTAPDERPDEAVETEAPAVSADEAETAPEAERETVEALDLLGVTEQPANSEEAEHAELKAVLEAVVYVLNEPMPAAQIAQALDRDLTVVEEVLRELVEETSRADRGIFIREVAGGYQLATKPEHHEVLRQFVRNLKQPLKLSQAALETLAVIAYKQPITLPEILEIRGVQGGGVLKTLIDRKLVTTAGRKAVIGKPMMYKTTKEFLTQFGLKDVNELPSLKEFEEIRRQSMADDELTPAESATDPETGVATVPEPAPEAVVDEGAVEAGLPVEETAATPEAEPEREAPAEPEADGPAEEEPRTDG
ncbi:MAG TPA: SMC-Scp complex subunit ScpB [Bryobacteraceae bacterium]|nr:SMC-Scp complex subunit ScpB [Bryobacteraceae bacterium]